MDDIKICAMLNKNKNQLTTNDILIVQNYCFDKVKADDLYDLRNDAKLRAVTSTKTYEEFKDIVDAAHLRPLDKHDKQNARTKSRLWNTLAKQ